tara:strand:+ start:8721 stop:9146 length:426 start_codon:yes stop_codon:yes gene_type:complete
MGRDQNLNVGNIIVIADGSWYTIVRGNYENIDASILAARGYVRIWLRNFTVLTTACYVRLLKGDSSVQAVLSLTRSVLLSGNQWCYGTSTFDAALSSTRVAYEIAAETPTTDWNSSATVLKVRRGNLRSNRLECCRYSIIL